MKYWIFILLSAISTTSHARLINYQIDLKAHFFDSTPSVDMSGQMTIDTNVTEHAYEDVFWLIPALSATVYHGQTAYWIDMQIEVFIPETGDPWVNLNGPQADVSLSIYDINQNDLIGYGNRANFTIIEPSAEVPEPTTLALLGLGLVGLARPLVKRRHISVT